jgi:hypothetical protein
MNAPFSPAEVAKALGGRVVGRNRVRAPSPGMPPSEESLVIKFGLQYADGFTVNDYYDGSDDWRSRKDYCPEEMALGSRPTTFNSSYDLSQDDIFTLAGVTMVGPGLGKAVRERFVAIAANLIQKHGLRAFEMPKRAAAIHEAGHVVINSALGIRTTHVSIDHVYRNGELFWIGYTDAPDLAFLDAPNAPAGFDKLLMKARTTYAGIAAEDLFAGPDRREGSSLDEIIVSQIFTEKTASLIGVEPERLWREDVAAWCTNQLWRNREVVGEIAEALMERKRLKGRALRDLWGEVKPLPSPDENWPDIHDHASQLADAGILPDLEDYA